MICCGTVPIPLAHTLECCVRKEGFTFFRAGEVGGRGSVGCSRRIGSELLFRRWNTQWKSSLHAAS